MKLAKEMTLSVFAKMFDPATMVIIFTKDKKIFEVDHIGNIVDRYAYRDDLIVDCFDTRFEYMNLRDYLSIKLK